MSEHPTSTNKPKETADSSGYVVVARRYRPRNFEELVGQQHVGQALRNAIETNRVGHAYLFTGARGVGKTSTARIFAKSLNHPDGPTATPDQDTEISQAIDSGEDVDVIEIDGASNRGIDEIRSLRANVGVRPSRSRYKIYIIDEVHMLTTPAFNALLKTLEEPPEHVKFIFCTTDPEKIPITVLSRCQRFDFAPVELQEIIARLRFIVESEQSDADEAALELIARRAAGSMRDSQSLLEQVLSFSTGKLTADQVHSMLGTANDDRLHEIANALAARDAATALRLLDRAIDQGVDAGKLAEQLLGYFRDLMTVAVGCDASMLRHASASMHAELSELGRHWGLQTVLAVVGLIDQTLVRTRHSVYARVLLEAALIQICNLPDLQNIANLAEAATQAGGQIGSNGKKSVEKKNSNLTDLNQQRHAADGMTQSQSSQQGTSGPEVVIQPISNASSAPQMTAAENAAARINETTPGLPKASQPKSTNEAKEDAFRAVTGHRDPQATDQAPTMPSDVATQRIQWNTKNGGEVWKAAIQRLESMTESLARMVERIEVSGNHSLRLHLPHDANLAKRRLDSSEHREAILQALEETTGRKITVEVVMLPSPMRREPPETQTPKPSRMQRMREIENNELIKDCLELFDAEIVSIDKPRQA